MAPYIGARQAPMAYSPQTGYFYVASSVDPWWVTRFGISHNEPGQKFYGLITAVDSRTNKIVWQQRSPYPKAHRGGMLATAGNLVVHGEGDGNLQARDAKTGELLWQFQTGSAGVDAGPVITYELDGEQYIALAPSGGETDRSTGDMVWAFKLGGTVQPLNPPPAPPLVRTFRGVVVETSDITIDFSERQKDTIRPPGLKVDDYETFEPRRARVRAGTRVTWKNTGHEPHTITVRQQTWTTGTIAPGATGAIQFDTPGTFVYTCENHPWHQGEITVAR
jgi:alcohol dehydrogenase (cytochrome c)